MIGRALARALVAAGVPITRLGRGPTADVRWDAMRDEIDPSVMDGASAVVHLAGATIAKRWTPQRRREIRDSRIRGTTAVARAMANAARPPAVLVSTSGISIYGDRGDELLSETSALGDGLLPSVAREWEAATELASGVGVRVVHMRSGVVLGRTGGALAKLLPVFRLGLGGRVASGQQWMSWISLHDSVRAIRFAIRSSVRGPVNVVTPNPVTNAEFARTLGAVLRRPAVLPVPRLALTLLYGEMAHGTILSSQRGSPDALVRAGFVFDEPQLDGALRRELSRADVDAR